MNRFHLHVPYLLKKDINELYITNAIRSFSFSIIGIFIPIFLLEKGFGFAGIGIYLTIQALLMAIIPYPFLKLAARIGVKHNMLISSPLIILYFLVLYNIESIRNMLPDISIVILLGIVAAIAQSMYWVAFHVDFAKSTQRKKSAKQFGFFNITSTMASVIGPLIGGLLITAFGFSTVFIIIMCLLVIAIIPLFLSKDKHIPFKVAFKDLSKNKNSRYVLPFFGEGMHFAALSFVWPLFLYLLFSAYNDVGSIYTIANTLSITTTFIVSHRINEITRYIFLKVGTWLHSLSIIIRLFANNYLGMSFAMGFAGITNSMMSNSYFSIFYNTAKKRGLTNMVFMREVYVNLGRFSMSALMLILLYFLKPEPTLVILMIIGALAVLFRANLREDIKTKGDSSAHGVQNTSRRRKSKNRKTPNKKRRN